MRLDVDERRAQLVELGLAQFGTCSYDEVSIAAIAEAAGISKGLLYHYFPTKHAFYAETVRVAAKRLYDATDVAPDAPPLEQLQRGLEAYLEYVTAHGAAYAGLMRSGVGVDPEIARIVDATRTAMLARLTSGLASAVPRPSRLLGFALRGWVALVENVALGWIEARPREPRPHRASRKSPTAAAPATAAPPYPTQSEVRDLLVNALLQIVRDAGAS